MIIKEKEWGLGIGDWGLGIGDWGLGPIPNPQSPIPNPQSPFFFFISLSSICHPYILINLILYSFIFSKNGFLFIKN
jgi:hypothetical protein